MRDRERDRDRGRERERGMGGGGRKKTDTFQVVCYVFLFLLWKGWVGQCADQRKSRKNKILKNKSVGMPRGRVLPIGFQGFPVLSWGLISQCLCLILESLLVKHVRGAMTQMLNYFQKGKCVLRFVSGRAPIHVMSPSEAPFCSI